MVFGSLAGFSEEKKIRLNLFAEVSQRLPSFSAYRYLTKEGSRFGGEDGPLPDEVQMGQVIFVRKDMPIIASGGLRTYEESAARTFDPAVTVTGNFHWVRVGHEAHSYVIGNLHGLWQAGSQKRETPERMIQARKVMDALTLCEGKHVLVGDFNTRPDIESMELFRKDYVDLIAERGVCSTRTKFYDHPEGVQFSDYAFVSKDFQVAEFAVLPDEVSDHSPLTLVFT
jgi:hypothetical protein